MNFEALYSKVIEPGLCTRCGICVGGCPAIAIGFGRDNYPELIDKCTDCGICIRCCPGAEVDFSLLSRQVFNGSYVPDNLQGHVEQLFVGHTTDGQIRQIGTSGALVTGLLVYLLKNNIIDGAVVTVLDHDDPCKTKGVLATTSEEIIDAAKSKYCISSSMEALQTVRRKKGRFAVVGLPCQVQGLRKLMACDPLLEKKIFCVLGLYCHCIMEPFIQRDILKSKGIDASDIMRFDFRGGRWPGGFHVVNKEGRGILLHTTLYTTILNVLFKIYGALRCFVCVDALAEFADLSFGDFWAQDYREDFSKLKHCTLVSQRTEKGKKILQQAEEAMEIKLYSLPPDRYSKRTTNMANRKRTRALARISRLKKNGQPVPEYHLPLIPPTRKAKRKERMLRLELLLRDPLSRKILLKFLFSRAANSFERVNLCRKKMFCNYQNN